MSTLAEKSDDSIVSHGNEKIEPALPPEEGLAGWLCVIGSSTGLFCTFGFLNAIGVFQATYAETTLRQYSPPDISWIFAVQLSLMWLPGPFFGRVIDTYGPRPVIVPCSILCVFSLAMTSLSKEYYQIFLAQGIGFGLGAGGLFTTCMVCAGQWFQRRRGLALGIVSCGSSLGGVVFPVFVNRVMARVGFYGTVRYIALLIGILLAATCFLVKSRIPRRKWNHDLPWFNVRLFEDKGFLLYTIGAFLVMWGLWGPFNYISSFVIETGFSNSLSIYLLSIINAGSIPGRIIPGHIADKVGYFNVMTAVSFMTGASILCLWLPFVYHHSHAGLIVFAIVFGVVSGAFVSLVVPCAAKSGALETLGQRFGTFQAVIAIACLTGLPIQGAILNTKGGGYMGMEVFSAISIILGAFVIGGATIVIGPSAPLKKV